jgi:hypothetical protein
MLGNFPAHSKAYLKAYCSHKLEVEDQSYCFRLPTAFVPSYMGNTDNYISKGVSFAGQPVSIKELSLSHQLDNVNELYEFCT